MSDTTSGPDETGATPSDEADATLPADETASKGSETADEVAGVDEIDEFDGVDDAVTDAPGEPPVDEPAAAAADVEPEAAAEPEAFAAPEPAPAPEPVASDSVEPAPVAAADPAPEPVADPVPEPASAPEPAADTAVDADAARTARLDEAVERANAGAATSAEPEYEIDYESAAEPDPAPETLAAPAVTPSEPTPEPFTEPVPDPVTAGSVRRETYIPPGAAATAVGAATLAPEPLITPPTPVPPQTIYVQAPVPPKSKGNRGFGVLVAAIGAVAFALIYAAVTYLLLLSRGDQGAATDEFVKFLAGPYWALFWVPTIALFLGFALLAAIINRGPWWTYAVFGLLVGVLVYFSYIGASLLAVQAWTLTFAEAQSFIGERWLDPFAIIAGVIAREIPIWLGGWIAARGRTVTERNRLALEAYDRELAAGPRPVV
ncbi:hypothetical protein [Agromyces allii]|uniref:ABC transporter n=1 Tax=Agromyces allii TaxID=393607 RepID=A0ABN2Q4G0_9MICO|nr:hypothetical protein [Agromyces allii]